MRDRLVKRALGRPEHSARNAAIIEVLWSTGARESELANARLADYDASAGTLLLVHTKTGQPRYAGVTLAARARLEEYLVQDRGRDPGPLFLGRGSQPLSGSGIRQVVESLAAGMGTKVTPHDFRRGMAARMLREGAELDVVQYVGGWATSTMALIYGEQGRAERSLGAFHAIDAGVRPLRKAK